MCHLGGQGRRRFPSLASAASSGKVDAAEAAPRGPALCFPVPCRRDIQGILARSSSSPCGWGPSREIREKCGVSGFEIQGSDHYSAVPRSNPGCSAQKARPSRQSTISRTLSRVLAPPQLARGGTVLGLDLSLVLFSSWAPFCDQSEFASSTTGSRSARSYVFPEEGFGITEA